MDGDIRGSGSDALDARTTERARSSAEKVAPESIAIRASPPSAIRFRKEVIIGLSGLSIAILMGVAWLALRSHVPAQLPPESDLSRPLPKPANDTLADLPKGYGDAPKLGPALPGDLGRPILNAKNSEADRAREAAAAAAKAEQEQRLAETRAARQSGLMATTRSAATVAADAIRPASAHDSTGEGGQNAGASGAPEAQDRKSQFIENTQARSDVNPHVLTSSRANMLVAGSVISASLITGVNSDTPGMVVAQVTQNVYDSATGTVVLIPQGARLLGKYDSMVAYGQQRALVVWQRLMMPDGTSMRLENMPATDAAGNAGLTGRVNNHTGRLIGGVALATLLGVGTELSISGEGELVRALRESAQSNTARAGDQITQRNLDVQPTITIRPGAPVRLVVRQDLVLRPWMREN
ncbi:conjugal transfer protein TrbI [Novosphingobium resinovorum]|uniref:Conjugal transfer protein TrbI n=2 Tax=Novosphingobium resinovorum TaxID=158500 RepID=A0A1D8A2N4_9SPHN|nr:conjugal transfer protein TrbI [Novosphingobium resinovorum]